MINKTSVFMFGEDGRRWFSFVEFEELDAAQLREARAKGRGRKSSAPSAVSCGPGEIELKHLKLSEIGDGIFPNVKLSGRQTARVT